MAIAHDPVTSFFFLEHFVPLPPPIVLSPNPVFRPVGWDRSRFGLPLPPSTFPLLPLPSHRLDPSSSHLFGSRFIITRRAMGKIISTDDVITSTFFFSRGKSFRRRCSSTRLTSRWRDRRPSPRRAAFLSSTPPRLYRHDEYLSTLDMIRRGGRKDMFDAGIIVHHHSSFTIHHHHRRLNEAKPVWFDPEKIIYSFFRFESWGGGF